MEVHLSQPVMVSSSKGPCCYTVVNAPRLFETADTTHCSQKEKIKSFVPLYICPLGKQPFGSQVSLIKTLTMVTRKGEISRALYENR